MSQTDSTVSIPIKLIALIDKYHEMGENEITIARMNSSAKRIISSVMGSEPINRAREPVSISALRRSSPITITTSSGHSSTLDHEDAKTIHGYFVNLIGYLGNINTREMQTGQGNFIVPLSEATYRCAYQIQTEGQSQSGFFGYFEIKLTVLDKIETPIALSNSASLLDHLIELADSQDFKTAIESIPKYLNASISQLQVCQKQINKVKSKQIQLEAAVESAINNAQKASNSSRAAWKESADIFHRKDAIEALQRAGSQMGDALVKSTDIHLNIIESQTALLEAQAHQLYYQKLLMDLSKGLLLLGSYNQQTNKALYQELKKQLNNASENEIGELGMRELQSVATQLKEHQDMLTRMDAMEKKLAELTEIVNKLAK